MSLLAVQGGATGTGTVTLLAPVTNSNQTLTLPDATGTVLTSATTTGFPAGSMLQVVQGTYSTETETSSSSYSDTGLTVSITPSSASSKILVVVSQDIGKATNDLSAQLQLVRNSTILGVIASVYTASTATFYSVNGAFSYLDSPATTSATTYKTQFRSSNGLSKARVNSSGALSTIIAMEIAA